VASGDPTPDGVVLWTRVSVGAADTVEVHWTVATDPSLASPVAGGTAVAVPDGDHTVHVTVAGLVPATTYWYGFRVGDEASPVGRTRTLPAPDGPVERIRIGVVCCAHYATGYFNAYARLAERDVDLVLHLGDYIYEAEAKHERWTRYHRPRGRCLTLPDYRARHGQYKTDPDLQALHARHPVVAVWDDHELAGNAWWDGAAGHTPLTDGDWPRRRAAAVRAYREWMPSGLPDPSDPYRIWRTVQLGPLADLVLLDTRLVGRERPAAGRRPVVGVRRRDRALLDRAQWTWLEETLGSGAAGEVGGRRDEVPTRSPGTVPTDRQRWALVASQVVMAPIHLLAARGGLGRRLGAVGDGLIVNSGQWDGYPEERERLLRLLAGRGGPALVVSGDLHSSWVSQLALEHGRGAPVAAEFTVPAVSAPTFARALAPKVRGARSALERLIRRANPHVAWVDTASHGYLLLDVTADRVEGRWWHVDRVGRRTEVEHLAATWSVTRDDPHPVAGAGDNAPVGGGAVAGGDALLQAGEDAGGDAVPQGDDSAGGDALLQGGEGAGGDSSPGA
jgi:phosphodiesterase/alkaline phosphatase D-like protein